MGAENKAIKDVAAPQTEEVQLASGGISQKSQAVVAQVVSLNPQLPAASGGTIVAQGTVTVPIPPEIKDKSDEIWIKYYLQQHPGASRDEAEKWLKETRGGVPKDGEIWLQYYGPYKDENGAYFVIVERYTYNSKTAPIPGRIPPSPGSPEYIAPSKLQGNLLSSGAVVPENRPPDAEVKILDWIPFSVERDEINPQGVKLISLPSGTGLSAKLDSRVWDNQQYHIVRVVRYPNGNVDEYRKGDQIPLNPGDVVKVPLFSYEKAASSAPSAPIVKPSPSDNNEILRQQLSKLPNDVKLLLGGEESFQHQNYQILLKIGNQIQQLSPEEFRYYKPIASQIEGNLDNLDRSIDIFTKTRNLANDPDGEKLNNLLFGVQPITSNPSWQQVLKDLIASIVQSPDQADEVLGELFKEIKKHWPQFVALIVAFIAAETLVGFLTALPEPTFLTKVIAVALQGLLFTIFAIDVVVSVESTINELMNWWNAASNANGNPEKIAEASRAFLRMIGNVLLLMLSAKGFKDQLNSAKLERLQAMLKRKPSTPSLPDSNPSSIIDLTYDPETKSYLYQQKPNAGADLNQPLKKITLIAERTLAKNALGEIPTFKIRSDRKILRCSSPCEELAVFVLKQIENLLTHSDESIRNNAEKLRQHTQQIVQDSKTQVKDDNTLLDELVQLESDMTELRLEARKQSSNPYSSIVNFQKFQQAIGNEVVSQVLRERGLPGLEALQRIGQTIDLNDFKNLINEPELGSGGLIEVENKRGSYFIKLVLEIAQKAEESGVITKNQKIKAAIPLLKETSSHEEIIGKLSKKIQEQNSIVSKARRTYNEYRNRPDKKLQEEKILQLEASKAKINLTELENAKQAIVTTSGRIEVILNPREWAELPCFSGDTLVWLVNGIKRIDELQAGELVLAFDFQTQQVVSQKIIKVLKNQTVHFYEIQVGGSIIQATGNHPFWVESKLEWIAARDLKEGMLLKLINDKSLQIESIILRECLESNTYNLSIDNIHNYFVGSGILVHNEGEIDYGLGGNHKVYIGKNPKYPQKIYIGMTKDIKVREKIHHQEAKEQIKYLTEISKDSISLKEQADLEFYQFKLGMKLEVQAKGILNDDMAKYLEENLVRFYEKEGQKEIMNREQGRISNTQMNEWAKEIAQDPNVINMKYCQ